MDKRYDSCTLTDLARLAGLDLRTFNDRISQEDRLDMIRLGWMPHLRMLPPAVVYFLRGKFIDITPLVLPRFED